MLFTTKYCGTPLPPPPDAALQPPVHSVRGQDQLHDGGPVPLQRTAEVLGWARLGWEGLGWA